jgi:hypothetical protein
MEHTECLPAQGRPAAAADPAPPRLQVLQDLPDDLLFFDKCDNPNGT